ncbi:hypothetical protein [Rossellomorea sp. DUT-2]
MVLWLGVDFRDVMVGGMDRFVMGWMKKLFWCCDEGRVEFIIKFGWIVS